jgi:mono/diheme cytochrome c family protein
MNQKTNFEEKQSKDVTRFAILLMLIVVSSSSLVIISVFAGASRRSSSESAQATLSMAEAESFYITSCSPCHGLNGEGGQQLEGPSLDETGFAWQYSDEELIKVMRKGIKTMPGLRANVRDEELDAVADYIKQWWTPEQRAGQGDSDF